MGKKDQKLSRATSTRRALLRSLTRALVINGKIKTTFAKAKFAQKFVEKLAHQAQDTSVSARRRVLAEMGNDRRIVNSLFNIVKGSTRTSGLTRIVNLPNRKGDAAKMARLEMIDWKQIQPEVEDKKIKKETKQAREETKQKSKK